MQLNKFTHAILFVSITIGFSADVHARFLQTDPIGYKDDMDLYSYVGNDPVNRTDPSGLSCVRDASTGQATSCSIDSSTKQLDSKQKTAFETQYKNTVNKLLGSKGNLSVTMKVKGEDGKMHSKTESVTARSVGVALANRQISYNPARAGSLAMTSGAYRSGQSETTHLNDQSLTGTLPEGMKLPGLSPLSSSDTISTILIHEGLHESPLDQAFRSSTFENSHQVPYTRSAYEFLKE